MLLLSASHHLQLCIAECAKRHSHALENGRLENVACGRACMLRGRLENAETLKSVAS